MSAASSAWVRSIKAATRHRANSIFMAVFVMAGLLDVAAIAIAAFGPGAASPAVRQLLFGSLALCAALGVLIVRRILQVARARRRAESGARLHLRFVTLFSAAAVAPAIIVAVFLGALLNQTVRARLDERVRGTIEEAAGFARSYVQSAYEDIRAEVLPMAVDLNGAVSGLDADPAAYQSFLLRQAVLRSFPAAYVVDPNGQPLARAEAALAPAYVAPSRFAFAAADQGDVVISDDVRGGLFRALYRLDAYDGAYLYVVRFAEPGILERLRSFEQALNSYREDDDRQASLQSAFAFSYLTTALLVLLAAVWFGLATASQLSAPIGRLAEAAGRVAGGDLAARVDAAADRDELDALGKAFNRMTAQLQAQRSALVSARQEAEERSGFIAAVLSGVSAGVIGLARNGAITAANPVAAALLGASPTALEGRRLLDVAPEFADAMRPDWDARGPLRVDLTRGEGTVHLLVRRAQDDAGGVVLTFDDVTELIAAQRHEAWKDVARRIAHEIKNPLTPIQLSAERLKRKYGAEITSDPETFQRCADTILRQVADIGRMVDEFSTFARMPQPRLEPVDVSELVREVTFAQRLTMEDVTLDIEGADRACPALCDGRLVGQALTNVLKNAGEAIAARRAKEAAPTPGRITVRLSPSPEALTIEVIDDGVGLPQDRLRLLEPYVTTRAKGAGLGLAIVRRVLEDHGGAIELTDAPPPNASGALVRLILPWNPSASPAQARLNEEIA